MKRRGPLCQSPTRRFSVKRPQAGQDTQRYDAQPEALQRILSRVTLNPFLRICWPVHSKRPSRFWRVCNKRCGLRKVHDHWKAARLRSSSFSQQGVGLRQVCLHEAQALHSVDRFFGGPPRHLSPPSAVGFGFVTAGLARGTAARLRASSSRVARDSCSVTDSSTGAASFVGRRSRGVHWTLQPKLVSQSPVDVHPLSVSFGASVVDFRNFPFRFRSVLDRIGFCQLGRKSTQVVLEVLSSRRKIRSCFDCVRHRLFEANHDHQAIICHQDVVSDKSPCTIPTQRIHTFAAPGTGGFRRLHLW